VDATGTLNGTPLNAEFVGTLRHRDGERPPSEANGRFHVDARRDTTALEVDATVAPLALAGLHGSYPGLPLDATLNGTVRLSGTVDSLGAHLDLSEVRRGGAVRADGALVLLPNQRGARDLAVRATDLDLSKWVPGAPASRFTFDARLDADADSTALRSGALSLKLGLSSSSARRSTALGRAARERGRLAVDSLLITQPGLRTSAAARWASPLLQEESCSSPSRPTAWVRSIPWCSGPPTGLGCGRTRAPRCTGPRRPT
jgi:hypothetical protein